MFRRFSLFALLIFLAAPSEAASIVSGSILVKIPPSNARFSASAVLPGVKIKRTFARTGWQELTLPAGITVEAAREQLGAVFGAQNVALNFRRHVSRVPNDPKYADYQWNLRQIEAPLAWDTTTGSREVVVAVIDSGCDLSHPDLTENLWTNPGEIAGNGLDDDDNGVIDDVHGLNAIENDGNPIDKNGHGTHVAGILGARGNNGLGVAGVNWKVSVMVLKFLDATGNGEDADAIQCLEYAMDRKAHGVNVRVTNNSWGGPEDNPALKAAFEAAGGAGILNIVAAGNDSLNNDQNPDYPGSYDSASIVNVAASDSSDSRPYFSNFGAQSVDLAAPGVGILSTRNGGGTTTLSGTSMASPTVAGAAALVLSQNPSFSTSQLKNRLIQSVDKLAQWSGKTVSGGRLNLARAVSGAIFSVSGQVFRFKADGSRGPLAGAKILVNGTFRTSSDAEGNYAIGGLTSGTYNLTAELAGYSFPAKTQTFAEGDALQALRNFEGTRTGSSYFAISGRALGPDATPRQNVEIFLEGLSQSVAKTDSDGFYWLPQRAPGTYVLTAQGANLEWNATPASLNLNQNRTVDFAGTTPDTSAPEISISKPTQGATRALGSFVATGAASDPAGVETLFFLLSRDKNGVLTFYNWQSGLWTQNSGETGVFGEKSVLGTSVAWTRQMPNLAAGDYVLSVTARDAKGNTTGAGFEASASFSVSAGT